MAPDKTTPAFGTAKKEKKKAAAKKKAKKPSRDFRGKKAGVIDAVPGPIQRAMGLGSPPC